MSRGKNILVTGGAGFIGANLVEALLDDARVDNVRVLDNLSTGFLHNIREFIGRDDFQFIEGDIQDYSTCVRACQGIDLVSHQAALGSVPRSIKDPITTDRVNIGGTLNMFNAVKESKVSRIIFAASSSTYGDSENLPKVEHIIGKPLSPYAITKYVNELYADVYAKTYENFEYIGLRYFNVFGPKQDPHGAYAAVIPLFIKSAMDRKAPVINGDGTFSRDFTFVDNAVQANILSLFTENEFALNEVYNVACGERTDLNKLWDYICKVAKVNIRPVYGPGRLGDIPHSLASVVKANQKILYTPTVNVEQGIKKSFIWYSKANNV